MRKQRSNIDNQKQETPKNIEIDEGEQKRRGGSGGGGGIQRQRKLDILECSKSLKTTSCHHH